MLASESLELRDLKSLVREGEGSQLEFKLKTTHPDKIMREVVAFANTSGGKLLLGVSDEGELRGLKFPDEDIYVMEKAFASYITPQVNYTVEEVQLENKRIVLIYNIEKSTNSLIGFKTAIETEPLKVYVRNEDKSIQASKEIREILKNKLKDKNFSFHYGEKEDKLMKYLDVNTTITLPEFAQLSGISFKQASQTLVLLVLAGVLQVSANESDDKYTLRPLRYNMDNLSFLKP